MKTIPIPVNLDQQPQQQQTNSTDNLDGVEEIAQEVTKKKVIKKKIIKKIIKRKNPDGTDAPPEVIVIE